MKGEEILGGLALLGLGVLAVKAVVNFVDDVQRASYEQGRVHEQRLQQWRYQQFDNRLRAVESRTDHSVDVLNKAVSEFRARTALPFAPPWTDPDYGNGQYPDN